MSRLKGYYQSHVRKQLMERFCYANPMQVPQLKKIVVNMGIAEAAKDKNAVQDCIQELTLISGQKPIVRKAKKAISNFKLRKGQPIGLMVTLRGARMYDFLDRLCSIAAPRIRDFRGFSTKCDGRGNYSIGLDDHQIFAELNLDQVKRAQGFSISFTTSAEKDEECVELLRLMGVPFKGFPVVVSSWT